ncbi:flagellar hook-length control protein FliK [Acidisoma sp. 7E03]
MASAAQDRDADTVPRFAIRTAAPQADAASSGVTATADGALHLAIPSLGIPAAAASGHKSLTESAVLGSAGSSGLFGSGAPMMGGAIPGQGLGHASALAVPTAGSMPLASAPGDPSGLSTPSSALAATVIALSQNGQSSTVLHLTPANLGSLSVHVALAGDATVNVVFVPTVPQTAQLIHGAIQDLHHALAAAGLSLGQAQIGGGTGGNAQGQEGGRNRFTPAMVTPLPALEADGAGQKDGLRGARAVA